MSTPNEQLGQFGKSDKTPALSEAAHFVRIAIGIVAEHLDYRAARAMTKEPEDIGDGIDAINHLNKALNSINQFSTGEGRLQPV